MDCSRLPCAAAAVFKVMAEAGVVDTIIQNVGHIGWTCLLLYHRKMCFVQKSIEEHFANGNGGKYL